MNVPEWAAPHFGPKVNQRERPLRSAGDRTRDFHDLETRFLRMAFERFVREQHEMLRRVPLIPEISPDAAAKRIDVRCLSDEHAAWRQYVADRFQNAAGVGHVFDHVEKMNHADAAGLDVPAQRHLVTLIRLDPATPEFVEGSGGDVGP